MKKQAYTFLAIAASLLMGGCSGASTAHGHEDEAEADDHEEVELTEAQMTAVDIQIGELSRVSLGATLKVNGILAVNPQDEAQVAPLSAGFVRRIAVREGQQVAKGQVVGHVESMEAVSLQQDYLAAREEATLAAQELERQEALAREGAGTRKNHQQARANAQIAAGKVAMLSRQLALYGLSPSRVDRGELATEVPVSSPISGTVTKIACPTGGYADAQTPLMTVVDNAAVYARLSIFEKDMADVAPGRKVALRLTNRPAVTLDGEVTAVTQALEPATKSLTAHVKLLTAAADLVPGMPVVGIVTADGSEVDALPDEALVAAEGRHYVFAVEHQESGATHFKRLEVVPGVSGRGYTQVKFPAPVAPGTKFVVKNAFYLGSMTAEHGEHNH